MSRVIPFLVSLCIAACGGSQPTPKSASTIGSGVSLEAMTTKQAAKIVEEYRTKYGYPAPAATAPPPTSMVDVLEIVRGDRFSEFEAARQFSAGKQGPEALTIRAYLELSYASGMRLAAAVLKETEKHTATELAQASQPRRLGEQAPEDPKKVSELQAEVADLQKVVRALGLLSEGPLEAGGNLAKEAVRQHPQHGPGHLAAANYFRLRRDWLAFDREMRFIEKANPEPPPLHTFLRAREQCQRYVDANKCRALLQKTLERNPKMVRAQANLVLVEKDIEAKHAELEKLRAMNPNHVVVTLAGKQIDEEFAVTTELREALGNE